MATEMVGLVMTIESDGTRIYRMAQPEPHKATIQDCLNNLDSMLGTLEARLTKQDVPTTYKGVCASCEESIHGEVCSALGKTWHPDHFLCAMCGIELWQKTFYEREGNAYCEKDYRETYSPKCVACQRPISDMCVMDEGRTWHIEHFKCHECKRPIGDKEGEFHLHDDEIYCTEDFQRLFCPICPACGKYVMGTVLNKKWHPACFTCTDCKHSLEGCNHYEHEGKPYCETHFRAKRKAICYSCNKLILRKCITAMGGLKFHPEHFTCFLCKSELNTGLYKQAEGRPYCERCYLKTFGYH